VFGVRTPSADALIREHCSEEIVVEPRNRPGLLRVVRRRLRVGPPLMQLFADQVASASRSTAGVDFDVIHAFRLYTTPLALGLARRATTRREPRLDLDMDEVESRTHARLAELYRLNSCVVDATAEARDAGRYLEAERQLVPRFDRVYLSAPGDAEHLRAVARDVRIVSNAVRPPTAPLERRTSHPFTFLFVGTLGYYPNADAVRYFCHAIVPVIRRKAARPFLVRVVGRGLPADLRTLARIPEVRLAGEVKNLDLEYAEADAVVVPLRAGGGTRIKVLEAFAHERPVVSTVMGMEGLDARPELEFLLGNSTEEFAAQCLRLMVDGDLASGVARRAKSLLTERYTQQQINQLVAAWD
jgi:glycosyltransferase involved in cell wall biosynthesis